MHKSYKEKANFFIVYILEAHPEDGWKVGANARDGIKIFKAKQYADRVKAAGACMAGMKITIPCLVDDMQNTAQKAYAGWPDRFYVIDAAGKVAFKGGPGPRGFRPQEAEDALKKLLR